MATDTSLATYAGHRSDERRSFRKQRTVNPLTGPTRYNFLYTLKAGPAGGHRTRPPSARTNTRPPRCQGPAQDDGAAASK
jgi:hypothetical protein